jgi:hypothetical protein
MGHFKSLTLASALWLLSGLTHSACSQAPFAAPAPAANPNEYVEEKPVLMKNEATGGLNINNNAWGLGGIQFRRGIALTGYKKWIFEADFGGMRHPKEIKTVNPYFDAAKSYVYGKQNTFNILRLGTGLQQTLYSKFDRHGVEIRLVYSGGLSAGFLKPVYLEILKPTGTFNEFEVVTEKYNPQEHFVDNIYGRSPFMVGIDEMKFRPGVYGKVGFNFEYAPIFDDVKAIEVGAIIDAYPTEVPIMALIDNKQLFLSFYINFMYGKKW